MDKGFCDEILTPDIFYETENGKNEQNGNVQKQKLQSNRFTKRSDDEDDDENHNNLLQEIQLPSKVYQDLFQQFPPNPLLPKSFHAKDDSPRSGGLYKFMKIAKFRGMDHGRSKFRDEAMKIEKINLPEGISMKKIFKVINHKQESNDNDFQANLGNNNSQANEDNMRSKLEPLMTQYGELVYLRNSTKDFLSKQKNFIGEQRDEVLEENLLDVKNLLKFSSSSQAANGKQPALKSLVNLQGVEPFYTKKNVIDKTLIFESRFESGNLAAALKVADNDYYLALQNDVNTSGNTQWFMFRVSNTKAYNNVRFSMLNLCKPDSLYNEGMKVLIYSEKFASTKDIGWHRGGQKIAYYPNGVRKEGSKGFKTMYTMTFTYEFEYDDDIVYFAYCYPYTYTELMDELNAIMADPIKQQYVQKKTLTETLAGNKCEYLTITSKQNIENMHKRKGVILTARVHPGESVGSWMMKGALDFLVDPNSVEAEYLRQNFVFKIVPMLNPDGVINGNYRCSLAGCDLNRRWKRPSKVLHPTIYATKQLCAQFAKERDLQIFCDFHGHSRRKNIFMYGCNVPDKPEETRLFPFIMSQICPFFVYNHSRFGNQKSKESTARMALFNELKCPAIYTIESSFCGNDTGPYKNYHFSTNNLMQTGRDFCRTLMIYVPIQIPKTIISQFLQNINDLYHHYKIISDSKLKQDPEVEAMSFYFDRLEKVKSNNKEIQSKHIRKGLEMVLRQTADVFNETGSFSSAGSDQAPSEDNLDLDEIEKVLPVYEDPELASKIKKQKTSLEKQEFKRDGTQIIQSDQSVVSQSQQLQQFKRKVTASEGKRKSIKIGGAITLKQQKDKKKTVDQYEKIEELEQQEADDEVAQDKISVASDNKDDEQKQPITEENIPDNQVNVVQKKRRRKNVESKDACTQTERSDYMLIKQRQIEKQKQLQQPQQKKKPTNNQQNNEDSPSKTISESAAISGLSDIKYEYTNQVSTNKQQKQEFQETKNEFKINQLIEENQLNEIKKILGDNIQNKGIIIQQININSNPNNQVTQKLIDEYLNKQKQGLVENIINQYNRQTTNISPITKNQQYDFVDFSNYIIKQQTRDNQVVFKQEQSKIIESSPSNQANSVSPSKKHRNLIQTRQGAQQIMNQIAAPANLTDSKSKIQSKYTHSQNQSQGALVGEANILEEYQNHDNENKIGNYQNYDANFGSNKVQNKKNQNISQYQGATNKTKNSGKQGALNSKNYENNQVNVQNKSSENFNNYTNWEKMTQNNQELTRLFYQLPGGTKSLLQNAINSQKTNNSKQKNQNVIAIANKTNLQLQQNHKYPMTAQKQNRIISNLNKKASGSADIPQTSTIVQSQQNIGIVHISSQQSKNEFPDIQSQVPIYSNNNSELKNGNMSPIIQNSYYNNQYQPVQNNVQVNNNNLNSKIYGQNKKTFESINLEQKQNLNKDLNLSKQSDGDLLNEEKRYEQNIKQQNYQNVYQTPMHSNQSKQKSKIVTVLQNFGDQNTNIVTPQFSQQKPPFKNQVMVKGNRVSQNKEAKNNYQQQHTQNGLKNNEFQSTKYSMVGTLSGQNLNRDFQQLAVAQEFGRGKNNLLVNNEKQQNNKSALNSHQLQHDQVNKYQQRGQNQYYDNASKEMNKTFVQDNYQFQLQMNKQAKTGSYQERIVQRQGPIVQNHGIISQQMNFKVFNEQNQKQGQQLNSIVSSSRSFTNQLNNQPNTFSSLIQNQQMTQQQYFQNYKADEKTDQIIDKKLIKTLDQNRQKLQYNNYQQQQLSNMYRQSEQNEDSIKMSRVQKQMFEKAQNISYNPTSQTLQEEQKKTPQKVGVLENVFIQQRLRNMSSENQSQYQVQQFGDDTDARNQLIRSMKDNNQKSKSIYSYKDSSQNSNLNRN